MMYPILGLYALSLLLLVTPNSNVSIGLEVRENGNHFEYLAETLANQSSIIKDLGQSHSSRKLKALAFCRIRRGLTKHQRKLCAKFPLEVVAVFRGFHQAVKECQHQLRNQRWNCNSLAKMRTDGQPLFTSIMRRGFKEVAFVHALMAAAVAKSVMVDCARGLITSCDSSARRQSKAALHIRGYDTFIQHGLRFSVKFLSTREDSNDFQGIMNKHNLRAGRLTLTNNLNTLCKCHGVSGSCSSKSCVNTAPGLRQIANTLKKMYERAREIEAVNEKRSGVIVQAPNGGKPPGPLDLIYMEKSPTYCDRDDSLGTSGVRGRICSKNTTQENSCEVLCCGRGFNFQRLKVKTQCQCLFKWCCSVECKTCVIERWTTTCK